MKRVIFCSTQSDTFEVLGIPAQLEVSAEFSPDYEYITSSIEHMLSGIQGFDDVVERIRVVIGSTARHKFILYLANGDRQLNVQSSGSDFYSIVDSMIRNMSAKLEGYVLELENKRQGRRSCSIDVAYRIADVTGLHYHNWKKFSRYTLITYSGYYENPEELQMTMEGLADELYDKGLLVSHPGSGTISDTGLYTIEFKCKNDYI